MKKTQTILLALSAAICLALSCCGGYTTVTADPSEVNEKQVKERLRRQKERQNIKRFLDMQIEERKKEENLLK